MATTKVKNYTYFIGIDISRDKLDYAIMQGKSFLFHREAGNNVESIETIIKEVKKLPRFTMTKAVFAMEQTGIYANHLLTTLKKAKANIVIESALHIRSSLGVLRGKYDKIDAIRIATYAFKNRDHLKFKTARRPVIEQLAYLSSLRLRLLETQIKLKTPLSEQKLFIKNKLHKAGTQLCKKSVVAIQSDLGDIDLAMNEIIKSDEDVNWLMKIVTSIPCVGPVTALQIIITTNEFKDIKSPKQFACYAGVAPFVRDSGTIKVRAKVSPIANKRIKSLLHICALGALRYDTELKKYYQRKVNEEGKAKMSVINALRYKLILRIFACVAQQRLYRKDYERPISNNVII
jgi:transposase